jgi:hypothetical protein
MISQPLAKQTTLGFLSSNMRSFSLYPHSCNSTTTPHNNTTTTPPQHPNQVRSCFIVLDQLCRRHDIRILICDVNEEATFALKVCLLLVSCLPLPLASSLLPLDICDVNEEATFALMVIDTTIVTSPSHQHNAKMTPP